MPKPEYRAIRRQRQADSAAEQIQSLQTKSMLFQGDAQTQKISGQGVQWRL